ncbi:transmembrane amino acid transporter protein-domain-containing protein [Phascolomyces articulosus]|uniref:Transmembrane amino acid transporter protein-domain-containing protein n=1 Tax=Phascolomyces articulosus TaxID=60185 RepID=A0AAD5JXU1_9FUNG|nr:transmembrane amino acid transporter protein-domain-containing protein [Phascolomyces articulosus]
MGDEKTSCPVDIHSVTGSTISTKPMKQTSKRLPYDWRDKLFDPNFDIDRSNAGLSLTAFNNLIVTVCGTGMLSLSSVLGSAGWGTLALLIVCWWLTSYCSAIMVQCLYYGGDKRCETVHEIAQRAFGKPGGFASFFFNAWILLGSPILYFVLCGENMNQLCRGTVAEIGEIPWSIVFIVATAIPFVWMKTFDSLQWTSFLGSIVVIAITLICVIEPIRDLPNYQANHVVVHQNIVWENWPAAIASIAYSLGGNLVFPHCEAAMKRPQKWPLVCHTGLALCAVVYFLIAIPGYYVYGEAATNPIYNSIPVGPGRTICIIMITINVLANVPIFVGSFAFDMEVVMGITVEKLGKRKEFIFRAIWRIFLMVCCGIVACLVPHFDPLQSLFGAIGYSTSIFIFPVLCFWKLTGVRNKPIYEIAFGCLSLLFGTVGLVFGTWSSVEDLIKAYS